MSLDDPNKRWELASASRRVAPEMSFVDEFLVLGAGTRLAKVGAALDEARWVALLAAAHGRAIAQSQLRHIERALEKKREGDPTRALIHLALSGVSKLEDPCEDARRLFFADALMSEGLDPIVLMKELGFDKYNPDQPRVPAGNPDGGQWTSADWETGSSASPRERIDGSATHGPDVRNDAAPTAPPQATTASPQGAFGTTDPNSQPLELAQDDLDQTCSAPARRPAPRRASAASAR